MFEQMAAAEETRDLVVDMLSTVAMLARESARHESLLGRLDVVTSIAALLAARPPLHVCVGFLCLGFCVHH
jgi:hypothetical protein